MFNYLLEALAQMGLERVDFLLQSLCSSVQAQPLIEGCVQQVGTGEYIGRVPFCCNDSAQAGFCLPKVARHDLYLAFISTQNTRFQFSFRRKKAGIVAKLEIIEKEADLRQVPCPNHR